MPLCVHCAYPAQYLYTTYKTKSNIRLEGCKQCGQFCDPLIEHEPLILLLDLILLKPRVFLHLLFNRGTPPHDATSLGSFVVEQGRKQRIRQEVTLLSLMVVVAETAVRVLLELDLGISFGLQTLAVVISEVAAQHAVSTALALVILQWREWYPVKARPSITDGRQLFFMPLLVNLTLLYTTLLPLLLQLFLSIWYKPPSIHEPLPSPAVPQDVIPISLDAYPQLAETVGVISLLWTRSDRVWAGTRLLGGMSAGFGLRVLLPTRPWETTGIVLAGWTGASLAGRLTEHLVGLC